MYGEQQTRLVGRNTITGKQTKGNRIIRDNDKCCEVHEQVDVTVMEGDCT